VQDEHDDQVDEDEDKEVGKAVPGIEKVSHRRDRVRPLEAVIY